MARPVITLLTDFGLADHYVGAMKGVILGICPEAQIVDITHQVPAYNIREGAWALSQSWQYFPAGTIHVAVVDPGVGSERRAIAVDAGGHLFIAPDNGVLSWIFKAEPGFAAYEITESRYFRHPVSRTFHGRDIFSPVAAHLANGVEPTSVGPLVVNPVVLEAGTPVRTGENSWSGRILHVDAFGNLVTNFDEVTFGVFFEEPFELEVASKAISLRQPTYTDGASGEFFVLAGSSGFMEVSCFQRNAAELLGIGTGGAVYLCQKVLERVR